MYKPHSLFVMGGTLKPPLAGTVKEIWECTIRGVQGDVPDQPVQDELAWLQGVKAPLAAWYNDPVNLMSSQTTLDYIKCNRIGADGKYVSKTVTNRLDYAPPVAGAKVPVFPDILTICWSWRTSRTRGPGSHGRIYPPNMVTQDDVNMTITSAQQAAHLVAARNLLGILNVGDGDQASFLAVVASNVDASNTPVTDIRIGNVLDVQRRRKSAEHELYTQGPAYT